jgi:hypothetical protein
MDIRLAIRALEVPSDEPQWQSVLLKQLGRLDNAAGGRGLDRDEQPPKQPKPLFPAI